MKPTSDRLLLETYPVQVEVPTRFSDMDPLRHVNNVQIGQFYEEGRIAVNTRVFDGLKSRPHRVLVANLDIAYLAEAHYPGLIRVGGGICRIGRTSYVIANALFQNGQCVGVAETVLVATAEGKPAPLSEDVREALQRVQLQGGCVSG